MLIQVSHIQQTSEKKTKRLKARLDAGELSFEEGVERYSDCPSKAHQGHLGWFAAGVLPTQFEKAVWQSPIQQISQPAQTEYGWHLFYVHAKT
ncbi:peptidyl-prolyl cis-trans isomerase [Thiomicrospira microaerophila]|nr:peptidyl-prolyl cis-trans isomerase [Thiomicrospira microaerophila]